VIHCRCHNPEKVFTPREAWSRQPHGLHGNMCRSSPLPRLYERANRTDCRCFGHDMRRYRLVVAYECILFVLSAASPKSLKPLGRRNTPSRSRQTAYISLDFLTSSSTLEQAMVCRKLLFISVTATANLICTLLQQLPSLLAPVCNAMQCTDCATVGR
jgi:hypothetical protein